jgi:hypothetical protein
VDVLRDDISLKRIPLMSRSSKSLKAEESNSQNVAVGSASSLKHSSAVSSFLGMARRRRTPWIVVAACLVGICGFLIANNQDRPRLGTIVYSSDDTDAQVVLEKEGQEFPLKTGTKYTVQMEPGHYTVRLVGRTEGLKLQPKNLINLDAGGKAFVTVRRERRE